MNERLVRLAEKEEWMAGIGPQRRGDAGQERRRDFPHLFSRVAAQTRSNTPAYRTVVWKSADQTMDVL